MTRLVVTADAEADLDAILSYLESEAGSLVTERYAQRFRTTIVRIIDFPESGAPRPIFGPEARIAIVYPYLVIYDYDREGDVATLLRILHGKRNISEDLLHR
jgi:toxin ParE1/3/4